MKFFKEYILLELNTCQIISFEMMSINFKFINSTCFASFIIIQSNFSLRLLVSFYTYILPRPGAKTFSALPKCSLLHATIFARLIQVRFTNLLPKLILVSISPKILSLATPPSGKILNFIV